MKITNLQATIISGFIFMSGLGFDQINWNLPGILLIIIGFLGVISVLIFSYINTVENNIFKGFFSGILGIFSSSIILSHISNQTKNNIISSFSPTPSELKLPFEKHPSTGSNLDAVSTKKLMTLSGLTSKTREKLLNHSELIYYLRSNAPLMKHGRVTLNLKRLKFQATQ